VLELIERFDAAHPRHEPHYYLSLLGTHPAHTGRGLGMGLARILQHIDEEGLPAYLESSNPANNHRYERHGFAKNRRVLSAEQRHTRHHDVARRALGSGVRRQLEASDDSFVATLG
jgi:GNAT superfamily N-acetyltransferase